MYGKKTPTGVRRARFGAFLVHFFSRWSCCWSGDWLRFARPSLFGYPLQEISNHLSVFASDFRFLVIGVGIGFALLAHPCLGLLCKKSATTWRCLHLIFVSYLLVSELPAAIKRKSGTTFVVPDFLRRERDSCFGKRLRRLRTPARVFSSPLIQKRKLFSFLFQRREGFEPPVPFSTSVFKTGAIDHSATSP